MGWVANATPRLLYHRERPGTNYTGGWVGPRAGLDGCGKSRPPRRDSIPRPSSPWRVSIPTELSRPVERIRSNALELYGHILGLGGNGWPKRILTWSPEGRKKRKGKPEIKCERELERVVKPNNLTPEDSVNRQIRRKAAEGL